ncbi:helix-turn-helix domain-containing protein [Salinicoccus roseus]|uniref:helix-turn-helix domain-containing protein n=1 Tax=Salinicoccus roseus TaxID=45670 RepID=UPI0035676D12
MDKDRLIKLRERKGWSKTEAAKRLNVATSTYSGYEYGHRKPDNETLIRLARLYDVSTDYLLGIDKADKRDSADTFDALMFSDKDAFDALPEEVKEEFIKEMNERIEFLAYKERNKKKE